MRTTRLIQARATRATIVAVLLCLSGTAAYAGHQQKSTGSRSRASSSPIAPAITAGPANCTVTTGQAASFLVKASGTAPLAYQWQKNGTPISGAASSSYTAPATTPSDSGAQFSVVVSNDMGSATSGAAVLTVNAAPSILNSSAANLAFGSVMYSKQQHAERDADERRELQRNDFERDGGGSRFRRERCVVRVDSIERAECGAECDV